MGTHENRPASGIDDPFERAVLERVLAGDSYDEIAAAAYVSSRTVRRVVGRLKAEAGVETLAGLGAEATRRGWSG